MNQIDLFKQESHEYKMRPYQQDAHDRTVEAILKGEHPLVILPTGTGKAVLLTFVIKTINEIGRSLTLAHRIELIRQAHEKMVSVTGRPVGIEKGPEMSEGEPNIIASIDSMWRQTRLDRFPGDYFRLIVTDEAHHGCADIYQKVYKHFATAIRNGYTATPDRADDRRLAGTYTTITYQYTLEEAINDGYCCRIQGIKPEGLTIDLKGIRKIAGDISPADLEKKMVEIIEPIAEAILKHTKDDKTMIFMPGVASAKLMAETLRDRFGLNAASLDSGTDITFREKTLMEFKHGNITHLVNCVLFTEGFDEPSITSIVICRPTLSRAFYAQMVGRGTRPYPAKEHLKLVEFTYNTKHDLVQPYELFACQRVSKRLQDTARQLGINGNCDYLLLLNQAKEYLSKNLDKAIVKKFKGHSYFDPFAYANAREVDIDGELDLGWQSDPITSGQQGFLYAAGFDWKSTAKMKKGAASALISEIKRTGGEVRGHAQRWHDNEKRKHGVL